MLNKLLQDLPGKPGVENKSLNMCVHTPPLASLDRSTRGFGVHKCPHTASKLLKIQEVFPASFSLPENIYAPSKLLRT